MQKKKYTFIDLFASIDGFYQTMHTVMDKKTTGIKL